MTTAFEEVPVVSTSSTPASEASKEKPKGLQKKKTGPKNHQGKGKGKNKLAQTLPTRVQDPQIAAFSHGQWLQYGQDVYGIHSKREGQDEQDFSMEIIDEIQFFKYSIDVELDKFDAKLNKITSDIIELKRNDEKYTKWYKLTNVRLDSLTNTCDRI
ncbi:hypothetical protein O181_057796 [Austropuccinia psidii MF-1]|uniref:Uncharacterized protein n=1 Tax=Austropuccinia psidii MF-1 TaxID=1389203 RepID=A0A9Q3HU95_9BASI|nr:hypothetical protein [Austropuccinia psidii MF-1]